ncbi:hypothetical protein E2C01_030188 [Portunus trituberculatus]|uniref:Uncharacterized protein n=1 Tax=Portunus trituberculatus TaxID=210409 RepID=A0A5B7EPT2_PORTR|nr:hypothetical protein [Portunus trituberculatus]
METGPHEYDTQALGNGWGIEDAGVISYGMHPLYQPPVSCSNLACDQDCSLGYLDAIMFPMANGRTQKVSKNEKWKSKITTCLKKQ